MAKEKITYASSGVNIDAGMEVVSRIKSKVRSTFSPAVMADIGSFGSMLDLGKVLKDYEEPVLLQSIDGVGTKVSIGCKLRKYEGLGRDIVSHACDDILVHGAKPLTFLDYVASQELEPQVVESIVTGMAEGCLESGISLVGGETAEMPPTYSEGEIDIVGCITGVVEKSKLITGASISPGQVIVGLASSGLHTNGYSLARKVLLDVGELDLETVYPELGATLGDVLLEPHRNYYPAFSAAEEAGIQIHGMAHLTGGGFYDNIPRILPERCMASINLGSWKVLPIFQMMQKIGNIDQEEMFRVFNMGIGMTWVVDAEDAEALIKIISEKGYPSYQIGEIKEGDRSVVLNA
ncbi:MAG: phosphoribosylformylglycinamidine cyclo-ligase [Opitutales bacterium]|nr:phosphoribosylformylglycinamidine cyclo-ligase [Opitutales bacterium]